MRQKLNFLEGILCVVLDLVLMKHFLEKEHHTDTHTHSGGSVMVRACFAASVHGQLVVID